MPEIRKILVPVDFSDYSKNVIRYAADFARTFGAGMHLVYVFRPIFDEIEAGVMCESVQITNELQQYAGERLRKLAEEEIGGDVPVETIIRIGVPFVEINKTASELDVDLIIIATHGHTGVQHLLFGSTAEKVVRKAPCPVLSLRQPVKGFRFQS